MQEPSLDNYINGDDLDLLAARLPDLYYAASSLLDDCIGPLLTKKSGVILWLIAESRTTDELGPYLAHEQIVEQVAKWVAGSRENARPEVSRAKAILMRDGYIFVGGGNKNVHLTEKGNIQVRQMRASARRAIERALNALSPAEQGHLVDSVSRLLPQSKPPTRAEGEPVRVKRKGPMSAGPRKYLKSRES
jgi:hypothetical protein